MRSSTPLSILPWAKISAKCRCWNLRTCPVCPSVRSYPGRFNTNIRQLRWEGTLTQWPQLRLPLKVSEWRERCHPKRLLTFPLKVCLHILGGKNITLCFHGGKYFCPLFLWSLRGFLSTHNVKHTHCLSWVLILIFLSYLQSGTTEIQGQRILSNVRGAEVLGQC